MGDVLDDLANMETPAPKQSALEQLAATPDSAPSSGQKPYVSVLDELANMPDPQSKPEPPLPRVTPAMNPRLAIAMAQKDASPTAGTIALAAPVALAAAALPEGTLTALRPIAQKYGIKALEGAGLGLGYKLYRELESVFGGK